MKSRSIKNVPPGTGTHLRCLACGRKLSDEEFGEAGPYGGSPRVQRRLVARRNVPYALAADNVPLVIPVRSSGEGASGRPLAFAGQPIASGRLCGVSSGPWRHRTVRPSWHTRHEPMRRRQT